MSVSSDKKRAAPSNGPISTLTYYGNDIHREEGELALPVSEEKKWGWRPVDPDHIASGLVGYAQFMPWKRERRPGGGWSKAPRDHQTGRVADKRDRRCMGTLDQALAGMERHGLTGMGFCVIAEDPFCFIDLDHCRDPETGEIGEDAWRIVTHLDSFCESSPSGTGLRLIVIGTLPPGRRRVGRVELYDADAYMTITGHHVEGTPATINARQTQLETLHARLFSATAARPTSPRPRSIGHGSAEQVLEMAGKSKNGLKFRNLYAGRWEQYSSQWDDKSQSAADMALCQMLAYWTNYDAGLTEELFRSSGLYRPEKWQTVRRYTIPKALGIK